MSIKKLFFLIVMAIFSTGISAAGLSFGFFDSPAERVEKFKKYFGSGLVVNGQLIVGSLKIDLPPGEWTVARSDAWVGAMRVIDSGEVLYKNPHGEAFLFQRNGGEIRKFLAVVIPLGPIWNRTWQSSIPPFCDLNWNEPNKFWQDVRSSNMAALDCSVVYYEDAFSLGGSWDEAIKSELKNSAAALNYLSIGIFISRSAGMYLMSYGELVDFVKYGSKGEFEERNKEKINDMKIKAGQMRDAFKRNIY